MEESGKSEYRCPGTHRSAKTCRTGWMRTSRAAPLRNRRKAIELEPDRHGAGVVRPPAIGQPLKQEQPPPCVVVRLDGLGCGIEARPGVDHGDPNRGRSDRHPNVDGGSLRRPCMADAVRNELARQEAHIVQPLL